MRESTIEALSRVLAAIRKYEKVHGYVPTTRDLCAILEISSPATVQRYMNQLTAMGLIIREEKGRVNYRLADRKCCPNCGAQL